MLVLARSGATIFNDKDPEVAIMAVPDGRGHNEVRRYAGEIEFLDVIAAQDRIKRRGVERADAMLDDIDLAVDRRNSLVHLGTPRTKAEDACSSEAGEHRRAQWHISCLGTGIKAHP